MNSLVNFLLLIVAIALAIVFFPIGILVTVLNAIREGSIRKIVGYVSKSMLAVSLSIDCLGNTIGRDLFNGWLRKNGGYHFGNYRETISRVLGKNKQMGTLTDAGRALANLLNFIDSGHVERAAQD